MAAEVPNVVTLVEAVRRTVVQVLSRETTAGEGPDRHERDCWLDLVPAEDHRKMVEVVADRQRKTAALSDATTLVAWVADRHDVASGVCCRRRRRELVNFVVMETVGIGVSPAVAGDAVATEIAVGAVDAAVAVGVAATGAADEIEDEAVGRIEVLDRGMVVHLLVPCASLAWPAGAAFEL